MFKKLKDEASSDYILDLVEYIETSLLRVDSTKRARIKDIVEEFSRLDEYCQHAPKYCTSRTKEARRTDSGLSEIVELPEFPNDTVVDASSRGSQSPTNRQTHARDFRLSDRYTHDQERHIERPVDLEQTPSKTRTRVQPTFGYHGTANDSKGGVPTAQRTITSQLESSVHSPTNKSSSMTSFGRVGGQPSLSIHKDPLATNDQFSAESPDQTQPKRSRSHLGRASSVHVNSPLVDPTPRDGADVIAQVQPPVSLARAPPTSSSNPNDPSTRARSLVPMDLGQKGSSKNRPSAPSKGLRVRSRGLLSKVADCVFGTKQTQGAQEDIVRM